MRYKINKGFIAISILIGLFVGVLNEFLVYGFRGILGGILAVTASMGVFGIIGAIVLIIRGNITDSYARFGKMAGLGLLVLILFFGSTALLEFIYEQDIDLGALSNTAPKERYVFLIDDSGSMERDSYPKNDPNGTRFDVVEDTIKTLDDKSQFAVYLFANNTTCITPMGSVKPSEFVIDKTSYGGGTYLLGAIDQIANELGEKGNPIRLFALTDGEPHDAMELDRIVNLCNEKDIVIDSFGFGNPDISFMNELSTRTGGNYYDAGNVDNLATTMNSAVDFTWNSGSDLLDAHSPFDALHIIMRILFLLLMLLAWTIAKELFIGDKKFNKKLAIITYVIGAVGVIFFEIAMVMATFLGGNTILAVAVGVGARLMLYVTWALTLIPDYLENKSAGVDLGGFEVGKRNAAYDFGQEFGGSGTNSFI